MGNSTRNSNQQENQSSLSRMHLNRSEDQLTKYLTQSYSICPSFILKNPELKTQRVSCLKCESLLFDDGLGRVNKCEECQIPFVIKDGVITLLNQSQDVRCFQYSCVACELVVGCGSQIQGIVGIGTKIYCYESYKVRILYKLKVYTQRKNCQDEIFNYFFSHPKQYDRLHLYTKIECISNVPSLSSIQFIILKQPVEFTRSDRNQANQQVLNQVIRQILRIGDFIFEVCFHDDYGFVIPNLTQIQITHQIDQRMNFQHLQSNQSYNIINQSTIDGNDNRQDQIQFLHRLLNTFIQLNQNENIEGNLGCEDHEIQQLPIRRITLQSIK